MDMKDIVKKLTDKKLSISSMESCTGGAFCNSLTNIEGASEVIKFSAVTYSNEYKIKFGVNKKVIDTYSVYSIEVADEMSFNISKFTNSDIGVGITGKLNRVDNNNLFGKDNVVFISVYVKKIDKFYHRKIEVIYDNRIKNKELVVSEVCSLLSDILK